MKMASSKSKLTEEKLVEGVLSGILTALVKGRTKTVLDLLADNPTLKKQTQDLDKSIEKLKKSIKKAKKSSDRVGGSNVGQPFRDLQKQIDKKYGGKY